MLISDFSRATGLPVDTIRFYVKRGLLSPATNGRGGRNPYREFSEADVVTARFIRFTQSLGLSLEEIGAINVERRSGTITRDRAVEIMTGQVADLDAKIAEFTALAAYLRAKIVWQKAGAEGPAPRLESFAVL